MAYSDFPNGLTSFGVPVLPGASIPITNGTYYFVSSVTGSNGNDGSMATPYATVAYVAANKVTAAANDVIVCLPGHAETVTAAGTITLSKSGTQVVGLGAGALTPTITISTANTATISVTAANCTFQNFIIKANFLSIAAAFTLTTATNFALKNCLFQDTSSVLDFLNIVKSTGAANTVDGLTCVDNVWNSLGTTSMNSFVLTANDIDRCTLLRNTVYQVSTVDAAILLTVTAGVLTNLDCGWNKGYRKNTTTANGSLINVGGTTSTGSVYYNFVQTLTTTSDKLFTTTVGLAAFENKVTGVVGASGFLIPAADS